MALSIGAGVAFGTGSSGSINVGVGPAVYTTSRSLRFRASASAYLNRTPASAGNQKTWTYSAWVKRGTLTGDQYLLSANSTAPYCIIRFNSANTISLILDAGSASTSITTNAVFRDPSAWYHVVVYLDTTQATAANRWAIYVNNVLQTVSTGSTPSQNSTWNINNTVIHTQAAIYSGGPANVLDGYLTEVNFIDGQALTPSSFGAISSTTGVWQPTAYTGTYGTNGFYLPFTDNSALTTSSNAGLGKDFSGNGNYWTTNNISITAGVTYDSMTDVPTLTSATAANFAVLNPLNYNAYISISNSNLTATNSAGAVACVASSMTMTSGSKYYFELTCQSTVASNFYQGVGIFPTTEFSTSSYPGATANSYAYFGYDGSKYNNNTGAAYGALWTNGDVIGVAVDLVNGTIVFYKNNTSQGTAYSGINTALNYYASVYEYATTASVNFGQRPFTYTPPTGFVALNTYNLPAPTVSQGNTVMDATLYTGTGARLNVVNAAPFYTDFVWIKCRSAAQDHNLYDSVRGVNNYLTSDTTAAAVAVSQGLLAFTPSGFTVGTGSDAAVNTLGQTYVAWQWQAGQGSTSSNTNGTITSTVSVNASAGFSVVTYTGTGANATVGHGLGVAPSLVIAKGRGTQVATSDWATYHASLGNTQRIWLNLTNAAATNSTYWNNTSPTSTTFSLGSEGTVNGSGSTYVAYCWTPIAGYSAFGSYTGNASTDGPFVYTGFRPRFILIKNASTTGDWTIMDTARDTYNAAITALYPDLANSEGGGNVDILSNGFKIHNTTYQNGSGNTMIYAAWAENPFKYALAR